MVARILKIVTAIAAVASIGFAVYHFRLWEKDWSTIDDGWASLIGSAIGAFLAVIGALYVSKAEERRKKKAFEDFVRLAIQNIAIQAAYLEAMAREPHKMGPTPEVQASIVSIQQRVLTDALTVFDREIAHSNDGDYLLRREIVVLDTLLAETHRALLSDADPVTALQNWHVAGYQVRYHATTVLKALGWFVPIPTAKLVADTAAETIRTWQSWNVTPQNNQARTPTVGPPQHQPLNHVAA